MSDDDVDYLYHRIAPLEFEDRTQPFIDGALQTRRQRAGMLSRKTAVQDREL